MAKEELVHPADDFVIEAKGEKTDVGNISDVSDVSSISGVPQKHNVDIGTDNVFVTSWKQWATETTLHGIKVIADRRENKVKRFLRLITLAAFLGCLSYLCYDQTMRYLEYNTVTKETILFEETIDFPAITICNHEFLHVNRKLERAEEVTLQYIYGWPKTSKIPSTLLYATESLQNMLVDKYLSVEDILNVCYFGGYKISCTESFVPRPTKYGLCFTFNSVNSTVVYSTTITGSEYGLSLEVNTNQDLFQLSHDNSVGVKLLIHPRGELPDTAEPLTLAPGLTHYIAISKHEYTYLPSPVRAFDTRECVETDAPDFTSPLTYYSPYTTSACFSECLMMYVNKTCKCIGPFFMLEDYSDFQGCKPKEYVDCHIAAEAKFSKDKLLQQCECPIPCGSVQYNTKVSFAKYPSKKAVYLSAGLVDYDFAKENYLQVRVYFDNQIVTVHKQVLEYEFADLLGSFGGYLGLAVGASLLTLLELLEQIVISCHQVYCARRKVRPEMHEKTDTQ